MSDPIEEYIIDLPDFDNKGAWSEKYAERLAKLEAQREIVEEVQNTLQQIQTEGTKADYNLKVYDQVGNLVDYNFRLMQTLNAFDIAQTDTEEADALETLNEMKAEFNQVRAKFEEVYSETRILNKPDGYILDQDHHLHPANQTVNFDWQFTSELMLLQKIDNHFKTRSVLNEGTKTQIK